MRLSFHSADCEVSWVQDEGKERKLSKREAAKKLRSGSKSSAST